MKRVLRKGFTLVEVLIVLIMIGVIAWLFISNFSNPIKSGTTQASANKIAEDMRSIADATDKYIVEKQTNPLGVSHATAGLLENNYLKFAPIPTSVNTAYVWDETTYTGASSWGTALADTALTTTTTSTALCQKINEMFTGAAATAVPPASFSKTLDLQCVGAAAPHTIVKPLIVN